MKIKSIFLILIVGLLFILPVSAYQYYTMPFQTISNSPADSIFNFIGMRLNTPGVIGGQNYFYIPSSGTIERVMIVDYSGTAGTNEPYAYYIIVNNNTGTQYLVKNISVNTNERIFENSSINIAITSGDRIEINRTHPAWATNPLTNVVGGYIFFNSSEDGYTIPFATLTNSPADAATQYFGWKPIAAPTTSGTNKFFIPMDGNLTEANIIMNATTNGTTEGISFLMSKNGGDERRVNTLSLNTSLNRQFNSTTIGTTVSRGDYVEAKRLNPTWVVNPLNDVVWGNWFVNTSVTRNAHGYMLYVQHLTVGPTDAQTTYFGSLPLAPSTTANNNKVFIPRKGNITRVELYTYAGTAGTAEPWSMFLRMNNTNDYLISQMNSSQAERSFRNLSMDIPVLPGNYFEIKSVQPTWGTNPATLIAGGYVWVEYDVLSAGGSGDIILPPVANFSANITSSPSGSTLKFFDQSNNTIPGTTAYYWNFIDGGTDVNSTDENPTFVYGAPGTYTVNHTIANGATTSKATGIITITGGSGAALPKASFNIVLTDTSTEYPTAWKWNATNLLGNNTEVTFATTQNPIMNFGSGNWRINFSVSNAFGTNTTNQTIGWNLTSQRVYFWNRTA